MVFNYKWSDRENGNFAIRKRSVKGIEAGKKIERKGKQTSDTHFFILVDEKDDESMFNAFYKINKILETIQYDYRQRGTDEKSNNPYLTKKDIENVLNNINKYENGTITIETAFSKKIQQERMKIVNKHLKKWKEIFEYSFGYQHYKSLMNMLISSIKKEQELKKKQLEAKKRIKELQKDLLKTETTINADIENIENATFTFLKGKLKNLHNKNDSDFQTILEVLYDLAKKEIRNIKAKEIQQKYRDRKNVRNGKPKRNVGRPPKSK
jgi:hypothetical protein